jgi:hypothetical protein
MSGQLACSQAIQSPFTFMTALRFCIRSLPAVMACSSPSRLALT